MNLPSASKKRNVGPSGITLLRGTACVLLSVTAPAHARGEEPYAYPLTPPSASGPESRGEGTREPLPDPLERVGISLASASDWTLGKFAGTVPPDVPAAATPRSLAFLPETGAAPYGPADPDTVPPVGDNTPRPSFGEQLDAVKWEAGAILAYMTVTQAIVTKETRSFHFQDEGWFGKDTKALGMDKLTHAFNAYLMADFLQHRIEKRTGGLDGTGAVTAALISSALQLYSELWDAHKVTSGFSVQDVAFNSLGAGLSVLRNTVPGLRDKLDFRLLVVPNSDIYTLKGSRHYAQQRYLFALTLAGFKGLENSPLRFVELHAGYYGKNFTAEAERAGKEPQRKFFFGVGLNLKELFFKSPRSKVGRWAGSGLDYIQIPYTAVHYVK